MILVIPWHFRRLSDLKVLKVNVIGVFPNNVSLWRIVFSICLTTVLCFRLQEMRLEMLQRLLKEREAHHHELNIKRLDKLWYVSAGFSFRSRCATISVMHPFLWPKIPFSFNNKIRLFPLNHMVMVSFNPFCFWCHLICVIHLVYVIRSMFPTKLFNPYCLWCHLIYCAYDAIWSIVPVMPFDLLCLWYHLIYCACDAIWSIVPVMPFDLLCLWYHIIPCSPSLLQCHSTHPSWWLTTHSSHFIYGYMASYIW